MKKQLLVCLLLACPVVAAPLASSSNVQGEQRAGNGPSGSSSAAASTRSYDYVLMIMLENVGYNNVIGSPNAPYINKTLLPQGTLYTSSYGITHPSLPNYLALFSGSTLWVNNDHCLRGSPPNGPFNAPNLYSELRKKGKTALAYMESLPYNGFSGCSAKGYVQKHNPFMFFNVPGPNNVPYSASVVYNGPYPATAKWPNFAMICPNLMHDMHDGRTLPLQVANGDAWLSQNLPPLITFANKNNGLVIVTMDESSDEHVPTILVGPGIPGGKREPQRISHYNVTRTIIDNFGLATIGDTAGVPDVSEVTP